MVGTWKNTIAVDSNKEHFNINRLKYANPIKPVVLQQGGGGYIWCFNLKEAQLYTKEILIQE